MSSSPELDILGSCSPDGFEQRLSRFVVGIDLGTTNCAVAYLDLLQADSRIENFPIRQWVDLGTLEKRELLPSFVYQPLPDEQKSLVEGRAAAPSPMRVVGTLARERGLQLPGRQIASAKSWLCHDGVDRRSPILPWQNDEGVDKLSPVQASALYLLQIREAWDRSHTEYPLAEQDIILTLPASFDQVARQLTIEAASQAGLQRVLPIEEPQAAFYAWLACHADNWEAKVQPGQSILVCDIGGGTTDFTLIRVRKASSLPSDGASDQPITETLEETNQSRLSLHRVAVGQHLILGGDNLDLALAKMAEHKIAHGKTLPTRSWDALRQACRVAKEILLGRNPPAAYTIHLPGSGSRLIGGGSQVEVTEAEVQACVLDGFFPYCELTSRPDKHQTGFQEFGLPFARDAAITRHLAAFLWDHRHDGRTAEELESWSDVTAARPAWILFNGGVMSSSQLCQRIVRVVGSWFAGLEGLPSDWQPGVLEGERLDLAVAKGAAYFGQVRRGTGVEIEATLACSYYLQTADNPPRATCIVPGSASPGEKFRLAEKPMDLAVGQPVQFPIVYSHTRLADPLGQSVTLDDEHFTSLPPLRTVIEIPTHRRKTSAAILPVVVEAELSQIGTLQMYCHARDSEHRWKLEFDIRGSTETDHISFEANANQAGILEEETVAQARAILACVFAPEGSLKPVQLMSELARAISLNKSDWPPSLLRSIWSILLDFEAGRRKSSAHEARWLNLLGYALRPGYGLAADDWRVAQTWRAVHRKLAFPAVSSRNESLILWRRIAGGFTAGQQLTVYQQVAGPLRGALDPQRRPTGGAAISPHELVELLRLVASLELLPKSEKGQLGDWLLASLTVKKWAACHHAMLWAIARLGSRVPAYGPLNCVVDAERVMPWLERLCQMPHQTDSNWSLAVMLCSRRVEDRYRDISSDLRLRLVEQMRAVAAPPHSIDLVERGGRLASEEAGQVMGESLPLGLKLR